MEELKDQPFALIGVNSDSLEQANKAVAENELNWRSFQNEPEGFKKSISADWKVKGWPTIVVLDADMKVRYRGHDGHAASDMVKELLAAMQQVPEGN